MRKLFSYLLLKNPHIYITPFHSIIEKYIYLSAIKPRNGTAFLVMGWFFRAFQKYRGALCGVI